MKQSSISMAAVSVLAGCLFILPLVGVQAASFQTDQAAAEVQSENASRKGPFDGYNKQTQRIWVDDTVYRYTKELNVVGTASKLGLLSDIDLDEAVTVLYEDRDDGTIPLAIEIRRH